MPAPLATAPPAIVRSVPLRSLVAEAPPTTTRVTGTYRCDSLGNPQDKVTHPTPGLVLMGGGPDVDGAFKWMIQKSGGGDFLVLRATGTDAYNPYIYGMGGVNSVKTLILKDRQASSDAFVLDTIGKAEAIFIAGGDQAKYMDLWQGTPLQTALQAAVDRGVPVGGTSAGLAVLGDYVFGAHHDTITSAQALANPHDPRMTIDPHLLNFPSLRHVITDSHFHQRDRMGRLLAFVADLHTDKGLDEPRGIGVDEGTAVEVEADGDATVHGRGAAYFLQAPEAPATGNPLNIRGVEVCRVKADGHFNLTRWGGDNASTYLLNADNGRVTSTQASGEIY